MSGGREVGSDRLEPCDWVKVTHGDNGTSRIEITIPMAGGYRGKRYAGIEVPTDKLPAIASAIFQGSQK